MCFSHGRYHCAVQTSKLHRWLGIWLRIALTVLLALGPFLHAHYGASHLSGLHVDGMDSVHATHAHHGVMPMVDADGDDESAAVGVATSYPREWSTDVHVPTWAWVATIWVLFVAVGPVLNTLRRPRASAIRAWRPCVTHVRPPALAPPVFTA